MVAALVADGEIVLARVARRPRGVASPAPVLETVRTKPGDAITHVRLGRHRGRSSPTTTSGLLYHWDLSSGSAQLTDATPVGSVPLTAVEWGLGGHTVIVGDEKGGVSAWFRARPRAEAEPRDGEGPRVRAAGQRDPLDRLLDPRAHLRDGRRRRLRGAAPPHLGEDAAEVPGQRSAGRLGAHHAAGRRHPRQARGRHRRALLARTTRTPSSPGARCSARSGTRATRSPSTSGSRPAARTTSSRR